MSDPTKENQEGLRAFLDAAEIRAQSLPEVRKGGLDPVAVATLIERAALTLESFEIALNAMHQERGDLIALGDKAEPASSTAARTLEAAARTVDEMLSAAEAEAAQIREAFVLEKQQLAEAVINARQENSDTLAALAEQLRTERISADTELAEMRARLTQWRQDFQDRGNTAVAAVIAVFASAQEGLAAPLAEGVPDSANSEDAQLSDAAEGTTGLFSAH